MGGSSTFTSNSLSDALFVLTKSNSAAVTETSLVIKPSAVGTPARTTAILWPKGRSPSRQFTTPELFVHAPWLEVAEVNVKVGGSRSVSRTAVTSAGQAFVTVTV